jgi:hypothetical protein
VNRTVTNALQQSPPLLRTVLPRTLLALCAAVACVGSAPAAGVSPKANAYLGIAVSQGSIVVNGSSVAGSATIFEGDSVATADAGCQIRIQGGKRVDLSKRSHGQLLAGNFAITDGSSRIFGYPATALGLAIHPDKDSIGAVTVSGKTVEIAALTGSLRVFNKQGTEIANVTPGHVLNLDPAKEPGSQAYSLTGCPVVAGTAMLLTDQTANITVELTGNKVVAGKMIQVSGNAVSGKQPAPGAAQIVSVQNVKQLHGSCLPSAQLAASTAAIGGATSAGAAGAAAAGGAASGAATAGILIAASGSTVATSAVIAGVAAAAASGSVGVAATLATPQPPKCVSPCLLH